MIFFGLQNNQFYRTSQKPRLSFGHVTAERTSQKTPELPGELKNRFDGVLEYLQALCPEIKDPALRVHMRTLLCILSPVSRFNQLGIGDTFAGLLPSPRESIYELIPDLDDIGEENRQKIYLKTVISPKTLRQLSEDLQPYNDSWTKVLSVIAENIEEHLLVLEAK